MQADGRGEADANHSEAELVDRVQRPTTEEEGHDVQRLAVENALKLLAGYGGPCGEKAGELADELAEDDVHERKGHAGADGGHRGDHINCEVPFRCVGEDSEVVGEFRCSYRGFCCA